MTDRTLRPSRAMAAALMMLAGMILAGLTTRAHAQTGAQTGAPAGFENLDRLDSLVAMSLGANRGEPGGPVAPIDRRLRLAPCPVAPSVEPSQMGAAIVSCRSVGWRIRVPLVPAQQAAKAPVSAPFAGPAAPYAAAAPGPVVKKGDPVQLVAGNADFTISRLMIAEEDGALGALIRVRQDAKAAPVMARVEAMGVVRIPGI